MQVECPGCKKIVEVSGEQAGGTTITCPACGDAMSLPDAAEGGVAGAVESAGTKPCRFCGETIQADASKCRHCGEWLDTTKRRAAREGVQAVLDYQKGMRLLGVVLLVLSGFVGLGTMAIASRSAGNPGVQAALAMMVVLLAIYIALGVFALKRHVWVNWVVAILMGLSAAGNLVSCARSAAAGSAGNPVGKFVGLVIVVALLVTAIKNIKKYNEAKAGGVDPTKKTSA